MSGTSGNTTVTKITIPTDQLRVLLPEDALIEIERRAVEKIAEEVRRKITEKQSNIEGIVKDIVKEMVTKDMRDQTAALGTAWRFPENGKTIIHNLVRDSVGKMIESSAREAGDAAVKRAQASIDFAVKDAISKLSGAIQKEFDDRHRELSAHISKQARAEFLAVLKEAKEAGL